MNPIPKYKINDEFEILPHTIGSTGRMKPGERIVITEVQRWPNRWFYKGTIVSTGHDWDCVESFLDRYCTLLPSQAKFKVGDILEFTTILHGYNPDKFVIGEHVVIDKVTNHGNGCIMYAFTSKLTGKTRMANWTWVDTWCTLISRNAGNAPKNNGTNKTCYWCDKPTEPMFGALRICRSCNK